MTLATSTSARTAAALTWSLLLIGGLAACGQGNSGLPTSGSEESMVQRQSRTQSDLDERGLREGQQLPDRLATACHQLLGDRSWPQLDAGERTDIMRAMHRRMRGLWDDTTQHMRSPESMPGPSMMTRGCSPLR